MYKEDIQKTSLQDGNFPVLTYQFDNDPSATFNLTIYLFQVEDLYVVENLDHWQELVTQHDQFVWKLEKAKVYVLVFTVFPIFSILFY